MTSVSVLMYTRAGCHLCEDAWQMLQHLAERYPLHLDTVDVDSAADLQHRHGDRVPVLVINGRERMWGNINQVVLERELRGIADCRL
jgi:glutaredoxin